MSLSTRDLRHYTPPGFLKLDRYSIFLFQLGAGPALAHFNYRGVCRSGRVFCDMAEILISIN